MRTTRNLASIAAEFGERIDDTLLDLSQWPEAIEFLQRAFPGTKVAINIEDILGLGNVGLLFRGFDPKLIHQYVEHYSKVNPWLPFWLRFPIQRAAASDVTLPSATFRETEFYRDFIVPEREIESASGIKLVHDARRIGMLCIHYGTSIADRYNADIPEVLNANSVKLRRTVDLGRITAIHCVKRHASELALQFETPAFVLDNRGYVLGQNAQGEKLLRERDLIRLGRDKTLIFNEAATTDRVMRMASEIARRDGTWREGDDLQTWCKIGRPYMLSLFSLSTRASELLGLPTFLSCGRITLLIVRSVQDAPKRAANSWLRFGLTPAEQRLADELCSGNSLRHSCNHLGIAYDTARNQLKAIFAKTGVHRQAELVALIARSPDNVA